MSNIKANVYRKDIEIWLKNLPKFARDCNYLRKNLMVYIRRIKKSKGIIGLGELKPQLDSFNELSNSYLRLGLQMLKSGIYDREKEPDLALELSKENDEDS